MALTVILQRTARDWSLPWTAPSLRNAPLAQHRAWPHTESWPGRFHGVRPPCTDETPLSEQEVCVGIEVGVLA